MLEYLRIKNLALIQDIELEFSKGLNVLTGESGVGKSFILRALDFVLGEKLQTDMIRPGKDKAKVEAVFALPDKEYVLRRELIAESGRSRIYINDNLSSQEKVRTLRPKLIMHTSQHGQQRLLNPSYHTHILDSFVSCDLLDEKNELVNRLKQLSKEKNELIQKAEEIEKQKDFLEYQQKEIEKVNPGLNEEEELEAQKEELRDRARWQENIDRSLEILHGNEGTLVDKLLELQKEISQLCSAGEEFCQFANSLEEFRHCLNDLDRTLKDQPVFQNSEQELEKIESRLWQLSQLQRKLNRPLKSILKLQEEIDNSFSFLDNCHLQLKQLERQEEELTQKLSDVLANINQSREKAAKELSQRLENELQNLGFSKELQVIFEFFQVELYANLKEQRARLMWIPNPGQAPQPLDQIASGGELSRFLLALSGLMSQNSLPTLLFDEVDAGIGGITLGILGDRIRELSYRQQVILISHWPQLACLADRHFQVSKEVVQNETYTKCQVLNKSQIYDELARMAGRGEQGVILAKQLMEGNINE